MGDSPLVEDLVGRASEALRERFGSVARWGAAAPGRVNLIGEHTDYNDGFVLPMAIDRYCVAVGGRAREGDRTRVVAVDLDEGIEFGRGGERVARGTWGSYVQGVLELMGQCGDLPVMDIAIASSVPLGGGLSSSASLEVAVATLAEQAMGVELGGREKALLCQRAEHEYAGVPCGIMDQFASVMGRAGHALLIDCRSQEVRPILMPEGLGVVVINSNVHHELASGEYAKRRAMCEAAAKKLGVESLREATEAQVGHLELTDEENRCVRHVVTENERTVEAAAALTAGDVERVGELMVQSHASLRDDYRVSCEELDTLVELVMGLEGGGGVYGARMTGGGFGGCVVAICSPGAVDDDLAAVRAGYVKKHGIECDGFVVRAGAGSRQVSVGD